MLCSAVLCVVPAGMVLILLALSDVGEVTPRGRGDVEPEEEGRGGVCVIEGIGSSSSSSSSDKRSIYSLYLMRFQIISCDLNWV